MVDGKNLITLMFAEFAINRGMKTTGIQRNNAF
jgi:hypothetical protein